MADEQVAAPAPGAAPDKPGLVGSTKALFADENFKSLDPAKQQDFLKRYLAQKTPEYTKLPPERQEAFAKNVYAKYTGAPSPEAAAPEPPSHALGPQGTPQSSLSQVSPSGVARTVGGFIPGVHGAIEGAAQESAADVPPITRGVTTALVGMLDPTLHVPGSPMDANAISSRVDAVLSTKAGRIAAGAARDLAQFGAEWEIGAPFIGRFASRFLPTAARTALNEAIATGEDVAGTATRATREALINKFKTVGVQGIGVGEIHSAVQDLERGDADFMSDFVYSPLAMGALGVALVGTGQLVKRAGWTPERVKQAEQAYSQGYKDAPFVKGAREFAVNLSKALRIPQHEADLLAYEAALGPLPKEKAALIRAAVMSKPEIAGSDFGLHVLRQQSEEFAPRVTAAPGEAVRVRVEDTKSKAISDIAPTSKREAAELAMRIRKGELHLISATGDAAGVRPFNEFLPRIGGPVPVAQGIEPLAEGGIPTQIAPPPKPGEPTQMLPFSGTPDEIHSLADDLMQEQIRASAKNFPGFDESLFDNPMEGLPPIAAGEPPAPEPSFRGTPISMDPARQPKERVSDFARDYARGEEQPPRALERPTALARRGAEVLPPERQMEYATKADVEFNVDIAKRALAGDQKIIKEYFKGWPQAEIKDHLDSALEQLRLMRDESTIDVRPMPPVGTQLPGGVVVGTDPHGPIVQTESGRVTAIRRADGSTELPKEDPPSVTTEERKEIAAALQSGKLVMGIDRNGELSVFTPEEVGAGSGVVKIESPTSTTRRDMISAIKGIVNGTLIDKPVEFAKASNEAIAVGIEALKKQLGPYERMIADIEKRGPREDDVLRMKAYTVLQDRLVQAMTEFQRRTGTLGQDFSVTEAELAKTFKENFGKIRDNVARILKQERGSVRGAPPRLRPLEKEDIIQQYAKIIGGAAHETEEGAIVFKYRAGRDEISIPYANRNSALAGLDDIMRGRLEAAKLTAAVERAAMRGEITPPQIDPNPTTGMPDKMVKAIGGPAPLDSLPAYEDGRYRATWDQLLPARRVLDSMAGKLGRAVSRAFDKKVEIEDRIVGKGQVVISRALAALTPADQGVMFDVVERGQTTGNAARDAAIWRAHADIMKVLDSHYEMAKALGLKVEPKITNYMPHIFNWTLIDAKPEYMERLVRRTIRQGLAKDREGALDVIERMGYGTSRDRMIQRLQKSYAAKGTPISKSEAETILKKFVAKNVDRKSANLEMERVGVDGYVKDPAQAFSVALRRNAKRIAEVQALGFKDQAIHEMISRIGDQKAREYAQTILDFVTGTKKPDRDFARFLYNWQGMKLTFSLIPDTVNILNTVVKTDMPSVLKALFDFRHPATAIEHARETGALVSELLYDIRTGGISTELDTGTLGMSRFEAAVTKVSGFPSKILEASANFHRTIAQLAGEHYFDDKIIAALKVDPRDARAFARLRELNIAPGYVVKAMSSPDAGELEGFKALAGKRVADMAQLRGGIMASPLFSTTPGGKLLYQLKGWAIRAADFAAKELNPNRVGRARAFRNLAWFMTAYPAAGFAISQMYAALGRKTITSANFDAYMKDGRTQNLLAMYVGAHLQAGGLGIIGDYSNAMAMGLGMGGGTRVFSFLEPPTFSSLSNLTQGVPQAIVGLGTGNSELAKKGARKIATEFGGLGNYAAKQLIPTDQQRADQRR